MLLTLNHYKFKEFLKNKALELGKKVIDVNEAYTSKTNNFTGEVDNKLGGKKFIKVGDYRIDRDVNGARGIYLRALVDSPSLFSRACIC
jgi:putative transposase